MKNKKIALFGGSFDPVHSDHINIAKKCHDSLGYDEVWMIPTFISPFKQELRTTNKHRLKMLEIASENLDFIKIKKFEINNNRTTTTFETVSYFIKKYPDYIFSFVIGSDNLDRLQEWNNFNELIKKINFIVFKRTKTYNKKILEELNLDIYEFDNNGLSSTGIRSLEGLSKLDKKINDYINMNLLFLETRLKPFMDEKRYQHCINVGEMSAYLAKLNNANETYAKVAGTLHDVTKRWDNEKQIAYLKVNNVELIDEPKPVLHSYTGYYYLKNEWLIDNEEILNAVFNHTVGSIEMSLMDKIVFCADKISKERDYENVQMYREACFKDLDYGFKLLLKNQYDTAVKVHGKESIGKQLIKTYEHYIKGE